MKKINLLSKAEMKKVMGGNEVDPGTCHDGTCSKDSDCKEGMCPKCVPMFISDPTGVKFCAMSD